MNLHLRSFLVDHKPQTLPSGIYPWKLPHGPYTIEGTSRNVHHGSYLVKRTPWKLPHKNLHHGSSLVELMPWN